MIRSPTLQFATASRSRSSWGWKLFGPMPTALLLILGMTGVPSSDIPERNIVRARLPC